jgi:multidrug efflux pump subunit AcrB
MMILGTVSAADMPIDMFPAVNLPVVAVATFYSGMPPAQIETNITYHLERQFTLAQRHRPYGIPFSAGRESYQDLLSHWN